MKGTRAMATTTMKILRRKKKRGRDTSPGYDIIFMSNEAEVGVSEVMAASYDKLLVSRVEGRVSSRGGEGVMNRLQVYHTAPRDGGVDRDVYIPKLVLRARERGEIGPVDKKRGPKKLRAG